MVKTFLWSLSDSQLQKIFGGGYYWERRGQAVIKSKSSHTFPLSTVKVCMVSLIKTWKHILVCAYLSKKPECLFLSNLMIKLCWNPDKGIANFLLWVFLWLVLSWKFQTRVRNINAYQCLAFIRAPLDLSLVIIRCPLIPFSKPKARRLSPHSELA